MRNILTLTVGIFSPSSVGEKEGKVYFVRWSDFTGHQFIHAFCAWNTGNHWKTSSLAITSPLMVRQFPRFPLFSIPKIGQMDPVSGKNKRNPMWQFEKMISEKRDPRFFVSKSCFRCSIRTALFRVFYMESPLCCRDFWRWSSLPPPDLRSSSNAFCRLSHILKNERKIHLTDTHVFGFYSAPTGDRFQWEI